MADISIVVDTGGTGDYTSLNAADLDYFGASGVDYVSNTDKVDITLKCTDGNADTAAVDTAGYTTNSTYTVTAITVDSSYRHDGTYPTSGNVYRLEAAGYGLIRLRSLEGTVVTGVAGKNTGTGSTQLGFRCENGSVTFKSCVVDMAACGTNSRAFYTSDTTTDTFTFINCVGLNADASGSAGFEDDNSNSSGRTYFYNCLSHNCYYGFMPYNSTRSTAINCTAWDSVNGTGFWSGAIWTGSSDYNASNTVGASSIPGAHSVTLDSYTAAEVFTDESSEDFSLLETSPLRDVGTNLYSSGVTTDIVGNARTSGMAYDIGPHEYTPLSSGQGYVALGGKGSAMNLTTLQAEVRRVIGREDTTINDRVTQALNRALRNWAAEYPWEGLRTVEDITHQGGRILTFPRRVQRVIWVADKTNYRAVSAGSRQWDREAPYSYMTDQSGYALQWEPAAVSPVWTNITNAISFRSTYASDDRYLYVTGRAYRSGGSDLRETIDVSYELQLTGTTGVTLSHTGLVELDSISVSDYGTDVAEVLVDCEGTTVGALGPFDLAPRHQRIRFMEIPAAGTVFRYGAVVDPTPLVNTYQTVHPAVDTDFLIWSASADLLWQMREGSRSDYARRMAKKYADRFWEKERMFGDNSGRIIPEDLT